MAKFIPTKCQKCGSDKVLMKPAIKKSLTKSVAKGECLNCGEKYEYPILLIPDWEERRNMGKKEGEFWWNYFSEIF